MEKINKFGDNYAIIFSLVGVSFMSFILIMLNLDSIFKTSL
jgi:hypothetical protein